MRLMRGSVIGAWCVVGVVMGGCPSPEPGFQTPTPPPEETPTPVPEVGVFITEVMANPDLVQDSKGEWIELYNASGEDVALEGWTITDEAGSTVTITDVTLAAGGYAVFGPSDKIEDNGGVELTMKYDAGFSIGNDEETLTLRNADGGLVDELTYLAAPQGASLSLDPSAYSAAGNDDPGNLCATQYSKFGGGDYGTPGEENDVCVITATEGDIIITEIMANPAAAEDERGVYIEVYNTTDETIRLDGWVITDSAGDRHTIASEDGLEIEPGTYVLFGNHFQQSENGGIAPDYGWNKELVFNNTADTVTFYAGETMVDRVSYGSGDFPATPEGASLQLDPDAFTATDNDSGANWCASTAEIAEGLDRGTPGAANSSCGS